MPAAGGGRRLAMIVVLSALVAIAIGVGTMMFGFGYAMFFAGIPYQDPTPEMQRRFDFHDAVGSWVMGVGGLVAVTGVIVVVVTVVIYLTRFMHRGQVSRPTETELQAGDSS